MNKRDYKIFKEALYIYSPKVNGYVNHYKDRSQESYSLNLNNGIKKLQEFADIFIKENK